MRFPAPALRLCVPRLASFLAAGMLAVGCQSYTIVQTNMFSDEDGNIVQVDYGRSESDHVNTFVAPNTGKEMEFKSKLVVVVRLPDDETFKAWQCMNFLASGTMYKTDNERWMAHMNGFSCSIYRQLATDRTRYEEVYRGVMCDVAERERPKKDERWKTMKKTDEGWVPMRKTDKGWVR